MSYIVDWIAKSIFIPVSDLTLTSGTEYELFMSNFLYEIRRLEWEPLEGLWAPDILEHTNSKTIAGADYDPFDEIINGYTVTFDPTASKVVLKGSNNNIIDVFIVNGVSLIPTNSLGATTIIKEVPGTGGLTEEELHDGLDSYKNKDDYKATTLLGEVAKVDTDKKYYYRK